MSRPYYATKAVIRYYGQGFERRWPDAPHVALANLKLDEAALRMFTRRYGPLYVPSRSKLDAIEIERSQDPLGTALKKAASFVLDLGRAQKMQELLRQAWRGKRLAIVELEHGLKFLPWFGVTEQVLNLKDAPRDALTLWADDMWTVVRAAFLIDYKVGRTKVCAANPDCVTPYFVESRKGQEFCSHKCAVLVNVRRFRQRHAKAQIKGRAK